MALPKVDFSNMSPEQIAELGAITHHLMTNPKTRMKTLQALKELDPDTPIPEIDAAAPIRAEIEGLRAQLAERDKRDADKEVHQRIEKGRDLLKSKGHDDKAIEDIEKRMVALDLPNDYEKAANWIDKERQFAEPNSGDTHSGDNVFTMPDYKGIMDNPQNWARGEAHSAMADILNAKQRR